MVDVQTLGEYPTTVDRIRLSDMKQSTIVWELVALNGDAQLHEFTLKAGENPTLPDSDYGKYRVIAPEGADRFVLRRGTKYRIELWGGDTIFARRSATFALGG